PSNDACALMAVPSVTAIKPVYAHAPFIQYPLNDIPFTKPMSSLLPFSSRQKIYTCTPKNLYDLIEIVEILTQID
ncbi:MAG: hypothetical protein LPK85_01200, partial [Gammaproteobacteria bacterium]|nr:hypothetical protein [Gammaproteobacteria bacterium]